MRILPVSAKACVIALCATFVGAPDAYAFEDPVTSLFKQLGKDIKGADDFVREQTGQGFIPGRDQQPEAQPPQTAPRPTTQPSPPRSPGITQAQRQQNCDVQEALNAFGFPVGRVDCSIGPRSRAAIGDYQAYLGWPRTGRLDSEQRDFLLDARGQLRNGAGEQYARVIAAEGEKGVLKAIREPQWAARFNPPVETPAPAQPIPQPQPEERIARGPTPAPAPGGGGLLELPSLIPDAPVQNSISDRCEFVRTTTQLNQGMIQASSMSDPDQALSEQFCEARTYAISVADSLAGRLNLQESQRISFCSQINEALAPARALVPVGDAQSLIAKVSEIRAPTSLADPVTADTYGRLCLGTGYRQDDAEMALSGALLSLSVGFLPYAEIMGHHLREGFGLVTNVSGAMSWYNAGLGALEQQADPVFLPSKSGERVLIMRAALNSGRIQAAITPGLPGIVPLGATIQGLPRLPQ